MSLKVIEPNKAIQDAIYLEDFEFACGRKVPMYQVNSIYALTQIIGYVKYINASYGNVLYRGQCKLYKTIEPSIYHGIECKCGADRCHLGGTAPSATCKR